MKRRGGGICGGILRAPNAARARKTMADITDMSMFVFGTGFTACCPTRCRRGRGRTMNIAITARCWAIRRSRRR